MLYLVVTGGIATGKSTFCRLWLEMLPATVLHDADEAVHGLYADPAVRMELRQIFGPEVLVGDAEVDRATIRSAIAEDPTRRAALEGILHPRVREQRAKLAREAEAAGAPCFLAEIPIFYEVGAQKPVTDARVVVVACSPATRMQRLRERNPFDNGEGGRMVALQADLPAKMAAADHVLWNEGRPSDLSRQALMLRDLLLAPSADPQKNPPIYGA
ncbi:MAG: dephospho-CoA kinase [Verrucomicrobiales bacterium]